MTNATVFYKTGDTMTVKSTDQNCSSKNQRHGNSPSAKTSFHCPVPARQTHQHHRKSSHHGVQDDGLNPTVLLRSWVWFGQSGVPAVESLLCWAEGVGELAVVNQHPGGCQDHHLEVQHGASRPGWWSEIGVQVPLCPAEDERDLM